MHQYPAADDIEHPIFHDTGPRVKRCFHSEIEVEGRIGYLNDQRQILRLRVRHQMRWILPQNDDIGHRLVGGVVFRSHIDGRLDVHQGPFEDADQPLLQLLERIHMRPLFPHLADQFPFYQFQGLLIQQTGCLQGGAFRASPSLSRRIGRNNRCWQFDESDWHNPFCSFYCFCRKDGGKIRIPLHYAPWLRSIEFRIYMRRPVQSSE
jgi:hypothetical protein